MFNDRDLNYYWQEYAGQLPKEQDALTKRNADAPSGVA